MFINTVSFNSGHLLTSKSEVLIVSISSQCRAKASTTTMKTLTRTKFRVSRNKAQVFEDVYDKNRQNMSTSYIFPCFVRFNLIYLQVKFLKTSQVKTRCVLLRFQNCCVTEFAVQRIILS
uniref:Uncharacterized protein n=1 Tax=Cacopsylla melanoneura TaxID=428564 RepID=A0A8D8Z578_9HEMI